MKDFTDLAEEYLCYLKSLNYSLQTVDAARYCLRGLIACLGKLEVSAPPELRLKHLDMWRRHLNSWRTGKGLPLNPKTVNQRIIRARCFLRFLAKRGYVLPSLAESLPLVKTPALLPFSVLSHRKTRKMLNAVRLSDPMGVRDRAVLELMYSSGLRAGEVTALDLGDIDWDNRTVRVTGKAGKQRLTPVGKTASRHLETYIRAARPFLLTENPDEQALFLNHAGRRMAYHSLRRLVCQYREKAGSDTSVTPHTFRRSCATEMIRGGANLYHVKELLGHESMSTLKHYVNLTITDLKKTHAKCHPREKDD